jgi:hypothetical protein
MSEKNHCRISEENKADLWNRKGGCWPIRFLLPFINTKKQRLLEGMKNDEETPKVNPHQFRVRPESRLPTPNSRLPTPDSRLPLCLLTCMYLPKSCSMCSLHFRLNIQFSRVASILCRRLRYALAVGMRMCSHRWLAKFDLLLPVSVRPPRSDILHFSIT